MCDPGCLSPSLAPCPGVSFPTDRIIERGHQDQLVAPGVFARVEQGTLPSLRFTVDIGDQHVLGITPLLSAQAGHDPVHLASARSGNVVDRWGGCGIMTSPSNAGDALSYQSRWTPLGLRGTLSVPSAAPKVPGPRGAKSW